MTDFSAFPRLALPPSRHAFGEANTSLWIENARKEPPLSASGSPPAQCDVAIVGAGLTGLWAAYYLKRADPHARVAIFEANHVAFGASGRAGGWLIGSLDGQEHFMRTLDPAARVAAASQVIDTVDEVGRIVAEHALVCGYHKGGVVRIAARHPSQCATLEKYRKTIAAEHGADIAQMLDPDAASAILPFRETLGGLRLDHCAVIDPARLALGLARVVIELGVTIHENCAVTEIAPGRIETEAGPCTAAIVIPAIEGYGQNMAPLAPHMIAVYSHVVATAPLPSAVRASIGLAGREAFADCSRISTYGQLTEDGRIVFGASGIYPRWGRATSFTARLVRDRYSLVHRTLIDLLPQLKGIEITHAWTGPLGCTRDFKPQVVVDEAGGLIWGGGYIGRGLAAANLFGRTIAELATHQSTARTTAFWVRRGASIGDVLAKWEPEPLRTIGATLSTLPGELVERVYLSRLPKPAKALFSAAASLILRTR